MTTAALAFIGGVVIGIVNAYLLLWAINRSKE